MHLMTDLQWRVLNYEQERGCSRVCGAVTHVACSSRRTGDIRKEDAWSHTCPWARQVSTSPIPCEALCNLAHTCLSLQPFGSVSQTGEKNNL